MGFKFNSRDTFKKATNIIFTVLLQRWTTRHVKKQARLSVWERVKNYNLLKLDTRPLTVTPLEFCEGARAHCSQRRSSSSKRGMKLRPIRREHIQTSPHTVVSRAAPFSTQPAINTNQLQSQACAASTDRLKHWLNLWLKSIAAYTRSR